MVDTSLDKLSQYERLAKMFELLHDYQPSTSEQGEGVLDTVYQVLYGFLQDAAHETEWPSAILLLRQLLATAQHADMRIAASDWLSIYKDAADVDTYTSLYLAETKKADCSWYVLNRYLEDLDAKADQGEFAEPVFYLDILAGYQDDTMFAANEEGEIAKKDERMLVRLERSVSHMCGSEPTPSALKETQEGLQKLEASSLGQRNERVLRRIEKMSTRLAILAPHTTSQDVRERTISLLAQASLKATSTLAPTGA